MVKESRTECYIYGQWMSKLKVIIILIHNLLGIYIYYSESSSGETPSKVTSMHTVSLGDHQACEAGWELGTYL
jgi:hypothetical protein